MKFHMEIRLFLMPLLKIYVEDDKKVFLKEDI
jgi:hypothetical protein